MVSLSLLLFNSPATAVALFVEAGSSALGLCFSLCAIYCFWLGLFGILEKTGIINGLTKLIKPIVNSLYGKVNDLASQYIAINIASNLIGIGGAATPSALKAIEQIDNGSERAPYPIVMLFVINATSIQLLPTTVMGLRASYGSASPADIILPTLISTIVTTTLGFVLVKLFYRNPKWHNY